MRKPDHTEIVAVAIPVLAEALAVTFTVAVAILLAGILSHAI